MSGKKINVGLEDVADVIIAIVPDTPPKTKGGRITRWLQRIARIFKGVKTAEEIIK